MLDTASFGLILRIVGLSPGSAVRVITAINCSGVSLGSIASSLAARLVTSGAAIEVPDIWTLAPPGTTLSTS